VSFVLREGTECELSVEKGESGWVVFEKGTEGELCVEWGERG